MTVTPEDSALLGFAQADGAVMDGVRACRHAQMYGDTSALLGAQQQLGSALESAGAAPESIGGLVNAALDNGAAMQSAHCAGGSFVEMVSQRGAELVQGFPDIGF